MTRARLDRLGPLSRFKFFRKKVKERNRWPWFSDLVGNQNHQINSIQFFLLGEPFFFIRFRLLGAYKGAQPNFRVLAMKTRKQSSGMQLIARKPLGSDAEALWTVVSEHASPLARQQSCVVNMCA